MTGEYVPFIGRTGGAIPITSESRHDILRAELVISIFPKWLKGRESVYPFYLFKWKTKHSVENELGMFGTPFSTEP